MNELEEIKPQLETKREKNKKVNRFPFIEHFFISLAAQRNSGKSYFIEAFVERYHDLYDYIYMFNYSVKVDRDLRKRLGKHKHMKCFTDFTQDDLLKVFREQEKACVDVSDKNDILDEEGRLTETYYYRCPHGLVILDDVVDSGLLNFGNVVDRFAERGRHIKLSVIASVQRQSAMSRSIRLNTDYYIIFRPMNLSEAERFMEEFIPSDYKRSFKDHFLQFFKEQYVFIMVDSRDDIDKRFKISKTEHLMKNQYKVIELDHFSRKRKNETLREVS